MPLQRILGSKDDYRIFFLPNYRSESYYKVAIKLMLSTRYLLVSVVMKFSLRRALSVRTWMKDWGYSILSRLDTLICLSFRYLFVDMHACNFSLDACTYCADKLNIEHNDINNTNNKSDIRAVKFIRYVNYCNIIITHICIALYIYKIYYRLSSSSCWNKVSKYIQDIGFNTSDNTYRKLYSDSYNGSTGPNFCLSVVELWNTKRQMQ